MLHLLTLALCLGLACPKPPATLPDKPPLEKPPEPPEDPGPDDGGPGDPDPTPGPGPGPTVPDPLLGPQLDGG